MGIASWHTLLLPVASPWTAPALSTPCPKPPPNHSWTTYDLPPPESYLLQPAGWVCVLWVCRRSCTANVIIPIGLGCNNRIDYSPCFSCFCYYRRKWPLLKMLATQKNVQQTSQTTSAIQRILIQKIAPLYSEWVTPKNVCTVLQPK